MNILFASGRETEYIRNKVILQLMNTFANTYTIRNNKRSITFNTLKSLYNINRVNVKEFYIIWAGFFGQGIALALAMTPRKVPVVLDAYISLHETIFEDRYISRSNLILSYLVYYIEKLSLMKSDLIITDTLSNASFFVKKFKLSDEKVKSIYVSCDEKLFAPKNINNQKKVLEVFTYNSFLKLHGNNIILEAAEKLSKNKNIKFIIGGGGRNFNKAVEYVIKRKIENVEFAGWIPLERLPDWIARADICLGGHFAPSPKAARVIPTKAFQFAAMRRPTILGDGQGNRELFTHGVDSYLVPMGNSDALAEAIATLADDSRRRVMIADGGRALFEQRLSRKVLAGELREHLTRIRP
jgi:glycosyltransferase involved in cell wall biosynthesis